MSTCPTTAAAVAVTVNIILPPAGSPAYQCGVAGEVRATVSAPGATVSAVDAIFDNNPSNPYAMQADPGAPGQWYLRPIPSLGIGPHNVKVRVTSTVIQQDTSGNVAFSCFMM